jgi:hypothetical protein
MGIMKYRLIRFAIRGKRAAAFLRNDDMELVTVELSQQDRDKILAIVTKNVDGDVIDDEMFRKHLRKKRGRDGGKAGK